MRRRLAALCVLVVSATVAGGAAAPAWARDCMTPDDPSGEANPYKGTDPTRRLLPYTPWRMMDTPCPFPAEFRTVVVEPGRVVVIAAGQVAREVPLPPGDQVLFQAVVAAVADPAWLAEVEPGVFLVDTAVVQRGSAMTVAAPGVRELRLTTRPHLFLGGLGATARFEGVTVTSWDPVAQGPDRQVDDGRPFVVYRNGSRLDISRSRFEFLGSDRTEAYGVSWRHQSTGTVQESTFAHNFFGVYLHEGNGIEFRNNVFHDNVRYGLDPHDRSHNLLIEGNEAYGNGTHGIVFSDSVRDSVIRNNWSHHNRRNGIVLHAGSNNNVVEGNRVEHNRYDGIVLIDSGDNRVTGNAIRGHDVGIRVNGTGAQRVTVQANVVEDSRIGLEAFGGADFLVAQDNVYRRTAHVALYLDAPQSQVRNEQIDASQVGVDLVSGQSVIRSLRVADVEEGLVARAGTSTDLADVEVRARQVGIRAFPGSTVVRSGIVDAPDSDPLPLGARSTTLFGYIGLTAVVVAVGLHGLSRIRNPERARGQAPQHVRNTA